MSAIRMIWWDYGRVLFDHLTDDLMIGLSEMSAQGESPQEICRKLHECDLISKFDLGEISTEEFLNGLRALIGFADTTKFVALWNRILQPSRLAWRAVALLNKNGYRQGVISNTNSLQAEYIEKVLAAGSIMQFRPRIYSYQERILKPDQMIYLVAVVRARSAYNWEKILLPDECVFIDDRVENVDAARACGWRAIHHNPEMVYATFNKLQDLGVRL